MKFSQNGLYIESYSKCPNCGGLMYENAPEDRANILLYINSQGSNLPLPAAPAPAAPATPEDGAAPAAGTGPATGENTTTPTTNTPTQAAPQ